MVKKQSRGMGRFDPFIATSDQVCIYVYDEIDKII